MCAQYSRFRVRGLTSRRVHGNEDHPRRHVHLRVSLIDSLILLRGVRSSSCTHKEAKKWSTEEWGEIGFAATTMFNVAML